MHKEVLQTSKLLPRVVPLDGQDYRIFLVDDVS
jgi:hypothetical protein